MRAVKLVRSNSVEADSLLDETQAARLLNLSPRTLARWRTYNAGPPYVRVTPRVIRYQRQALREWLESRTLRPTA